MVNNETDHLSWEPRISPGKAVQGHANLHSMTGQDDTYQKALFPRLSATIHRLVQGAVWPLHVTPPPPPNRGNVAP
jgi:hypothetical protein